MQIELKINSDPANLAPVRQALEALGRNSGFDGNAVGDIGLCVNEALANIMRHAYGGARDRPIEISADVVDQTMTIRIRDWGSGVVPPPCSRARREPDRPGGVGMICLQELMDQVIFAPQSDGMLLTLVRQNETFTRRT